MRITRHAPGLFVVGVLVALAYAIHGAVPALSQLTMAVVLGVIVGNAFALPASTSPGVAFAAKRLMRIGVALLGIELSVQSIAHLGLATLIAVLVVVVCTILGVALLARLLGLSTDFGLLIGIGYGICGASAVAAAKTQLRTTEEQASYAVALVALCGTLSIAVLPALGAVLGLTDVVFGRWVGAAVHDVGQVVATASTRSDIALHAAVVVKLARVALLAPVVVLLSLRARRHHEPAADAHTPMLPLFVVAFLVLALAHSSGVVPAAIADALLLASKMALAAGLAGLGLGVRWRSLRAVGGRPLLLGLLAWILVAGLALVAVSITN